MLIEKVLGIDWRSRSLAHLQKPPLDCSLCGHILRKDLWHAHWWPGAATLTFSLGCRWKTHSCIPESMPMDLKTNDRPDKHSKSGALRTVRSCWRFSTSKSYDLLFRLQSWEGEDPWRGCGCGTCCWISTWRTRRYLDGEKGAAGFLRYWVTAPGPGDGWEWEERQAKSRLNFRTWYTRNFIVLESVFIIKKKKKTNSYVVSRC